MPKFLKVLLAIQFVQAGMQLGSWMGAQLRYILTGDRSQGGQFSFRDEAGREYKTIPPVTHAFPGLVLALLNRKQPWMWAFIGSFIASLVLGDRLELQAILAITEKVRQIEESNKAAPEAEPAATA